MRALTPSTASALLALLGAPAFPAGAGPLAAQQALDVCDLALRLSSARPGAACLDRRRLPLPVAPADSTRSGETFYEILPVSVRTALRSAYPIDRNDGALWGGKGVSGAVTFGGVVRWGRLTLALEPVVTASENRSFALPDTVSPVLSRFANPFQSERLDAFLRPGGGTRSDVTFGESFLSVDLDPIEVGLSNERLWWGPARRYPLLFSGTAEGFPHIYFETARPVDTPLGSFGARLLWGRLEESPWFDADPRNNFRLLGAFQLQWRVGLVPGLEIAYSVARHEPLPGRSLNVGQIGQLFHGDPSGEDPERRGTPMGTLAFRLALPGSGFEAYAEIGRGEGFVNPDPGVSDTRLSSIYVLGFAYTDTTRTGARWRFSGEAMKQALEEPQPDRTAQRPPAGVLASQGHTNRGQLLGAFVGPGSNAQYVAVDYMTGTRSWGGFVERARRDDDTFFRLLSQDYGFRGHDLEWTIGLRAGERVDWAPLARAVGPLTVGVDAGLSRRKNRNFAGLDRQIHDAFRREWNAWADIEVRWTTR